jgi:hypothetical protein
VLFRRNTVAATKLNSDKIREDMQKQMKELMESKKGFDENDEDDHSDS